MKFKTKLLGVAVLPVILISIASFWVIQFQSQELARNQISELEQRTLASRRMELENMTQLAVNSIRSLYEDSSLPLIEAQARAKALLHDMTFGEDGYFYVYDETGNNIVHPRLPHLVGKNWWDLEDPNGDYVIRNLITVAKSGGGFHNYVWNKPSTGQLAPKIGHAVFLDKWKWMIGTGLYIDDVEAEIALMRSTVQSGIDRTKTVILTLLVAGVLLAALFTWVIRLSEQKFADRRLRELTHRIVEVQEDERKRVSVELHDGISQLLVSARYGLDQAMNRMQKGADAASSLEKSMGTIDNAISEVRRISMALRPSVLDDIGLSAAIKSLGREFSEQTGIDIHIKTEKIEQRISENARTALYRVAQEALTNIAKHSEATFVQISLSHSIRDVTLSIKDNGALHNIGIGDSKTTDFGGFQSRTGMGLRNMQERMDAFNGKLSVVGHNENGLLIIAKIPIEQNWKQLGNDNLASDETVKSDAA